MISIRARLLTLLLGGLPLVLFAGGFAVHHVTRAGLMSEFDARVESKVRTLASLVTLEGWALTFESDDGPADLLGDVTYELRTEAGELLKRSAKYGIDGPRPVPAETTITFTEVTLADRRPGRAAWYTFRPRVEPPDDDDDIDPNLPPPPEVAPEAIVAMAALDRTPVDAALATVTRAVVLVGIGVAAAAALLIALGVRWGLGPLERLRSTLEEIDPDAPTARMDETSVPAELAPVYDELNLMLDRVESTLNRERTFAHAAAHELRTPLAELRTTAEVALRWPDAEGAEASLTELLAIGNEMERLVESLLAMSRAGASDGETTATPIRELVDSCLQREEERITTHGLHVAVDVDAHAVMAGHHDALTVIIRNLISNAVHYTPAAGSIVIRSSDGTFMVENGPVALTSEDVPHLFEPFWRLEHARSERDHAGLGLAVVRSVADAIGLRVDAALHEEHLHLTVSARPE